MTKKTVKALSTTIPKPLKLPFETRTAFHWLEAAWLSPYWIWRQGVVRKTRGAFWRNLFAIRRENPTRLGTYVAICAHAEHFIAYTAEIATQMKAKIAAAEAARAAGAKDFELVSISFDPAHDTPGARLHNAMEKRFSKVLFLRQFLRGDRSADSGLAMGIRRTDGALPRAMMTSSPASAWASSFDSCVLA